MAGVKGRSGRRSTSEETKRLQVLQKAWETVYEALNNEELSLKYRTDLSAKLIVKDMPTQIDADVKVTEMPNIKIGDKPIVFDIGQPIDD